MKKRMLAALLSLLMLLCLLPPTAMAAEGTVRRTATYQVGAPGSFAQYYKTKIDVEIDLTSNTAVVTFARMGLEEPEGYLSAGGEKIPPTKSQMNAYKTLRANSEGKMRFQKVKIGKADYFYEFVLEDPVWESEPYIISNSGEQYSYPQKQIRINHKDINAIHFVGDIVFGKSKDCNEPWGQSAGETRTVIFSSEASTPAAPVNSGANKFVFGEDSFSFVNSYSSFFPKIPNTQADSGLVYDTSKGYQLSEQYYNMLIEGLPPSEVAAITSFQNGGFVGNCFGMSALSALLYAGDVKLSQLQSDASNPYALNPPIQNMALRDAIVYYQLMQRTNAVLQLMQMSEKGISENANSLVFDLKSNLPKPVIFTIYREKSGHALLAYDMEETDSGYKIMVYDPNDSKKPIVMTISKDYATVTYDRKYNDSRLGMSMPLSLGFLKSAKFQASLAPIKQPDLPENSLVLTTNTSTLTLESGGKTAEFKEGKKVSGKLNVQCLGPINEIDQEEEVIFFMNPLTPVKAPIRVRAGEQFKLRYQSISPKGKSDGLFVSVQSHGATDISITPGSSCVLEVSNPSGSEIRCGVASDKTKGKLFATSVSSASKKLTVTPSTSGATVKTSDGAKANITVSGATESVRFSDVNTASPVDITSSGLESTLTRNGKPITKGTADSQGGSSNTSTVPDAVVINTSAISESIRKSSASCSNKIIDAMKHAESTAEEFVKLGYPHSTWARNELARAQKLGIIPSSIQNKLDKNMTRGEFADLVYETVKAVTAMPDDQMNALSKSPSADNIYQDQYNSKAIRFVYGCGIVNGYPDGSFASSNYITRSEAAKMLVRTAELMGKTMSEGGSKHFQDSPYDWSQNYINKISAISSLYSGLSVMGGDQNGNFVPRGYYTCEQAVATMLRITESTIGELSAYLGGVIEIKNSSSTSGETADTIGFVPNDWTWAAEGEGYGRPYFTSGKYLRADGRSVLYIESSDSPDYFSYQIYTMPDGAKQSAYRAPSSGTQEHWKYQGMTGTCSYASANHSSDTHADDTIEGLSFQAGKHTVTIKSDWLDELYYQYSTPDGVYTLVREKK